MPTTPPGAEAGSERLGQILIVRLLVMSVQPFESVVVMENVNVPAVVGVPPMDAPVKESPGGNAPADTLNEYGATLPDAENVTPA